MQSPILCPNEGNVVEFHKDGLSPHYEISEENDFPLPHWTIVKNTKKNIFCYKGVWFGQSVWKQEKDNSFIKYCPVQC